MNIGIIFLFGEFLTLYFFNFPLHEHHFYLQNDKILLDEKLEEMLPIQAFRQVISCYFGDGNVVHGRENKGNREC